jgi:hypothetical protein
MEKRKRSLFIDLPLVKLYLDDVYAIIDIFKENNCKDIYLQTNEYNVSNFEDLRKVLTMSKHYLKIGCKDPYIYLELDRYDARLYAYEDSAINRGILAKIEDIIRRNKRILDNIFNNSWFTGFSCSLIAALMILLVSFSHGLITWIGIALLIFIFIFTLYYNNRVSTKKYSIIIPIEKLVNKSFFVRNRDKLLVAIVSLIIGTLLTLGTTLLIYKLTH